MEGGGEGGREGGRKERQKQRERQRERERARAHDTVQPYDPPVIRACQGVAWLAQAGRLRLQQPTYLAVPR